MRLCSAALLPVLVLAVVGVALGDDKKGGQKPEAKGSFTFDGTTYKVASILAYATTVGDRKQTVVILSDKPLDAAQLKQSLKKFGDAAEFSPLGDTIEFTFDDKGAFRELAIITTEGGMKHVRAEEIKDHKATVAVTDTAAKGQVAVAKDTRETLTKHTYRFDVTFDVRLTKP